MKRAISCPIGFNACWLFLAIAVIVLFGITDFSSAFTKKMTTSDTPIVSEECLICNGENIDGTCKTNDVPVFSLGSRCNTILENYPGEGIIAGALTIDQRSPPGYQFGSYYDPHFSYVSACAGDSCVLSGRCNAGTDTTYGKVAQCDLIPCTSDGDGDGAVSCTPQIAGNNGKLDTSGTIVDCDDRNPYIERGDRFDFNIVSFAPMKDNPNIYEMYVQTKGCNFYTSEFMRQKIPSAISLLSERGDITLIKQQNYTNGGLYYAQVDMTPAIGGIVETRYDEIQITELAYMSVEDIEREIRDILEEEKRNKENNQEYKRRLQQVQKNKGILPQKTSLTGNGNIGTSSNNDLKPRTQTRRADTKVETCKLVAGDADSPNRIVIMRGDSAKVDDIKLARYAEQVSQAFSGTYPFSKYADKFAYYIDSMPYDDMEGGTFSAMKSEEWISGGEHDYEIQEQQSQKFALTQDGLNLVIAVKYENSDVLKIKLAWVDKNNNKIEKSYNIELTEDQKKYEFPVQYNFQSSPLFKVKIAIYGYSNDKLRYSLQLIRKEGYYSSAVIDNLRASSLCGSDANMYIFLTGKTMRAYAQTRTRAREGEYIGIVKGNVLFLPSVIAPVGGNDLLRKVVLHESGHAFCGLADEYPIQETIEEERASSFVKTNCVSNSNSYISNGKRYGASSIIGCGVNSIKTSRGEQIPVFRPSSVSIMNDHTESDLFNVISCGYCMAALEGEDYKDARRYWDVCSKMDTVAG